MPEYLSPGVYVEEVDAGPKPIEGVSTSTAGFLGETERGPTAPQLVTSIGRFYAIYGGPLQDRYLAYAVDGFFRNGGQRCFIGRIVNAASATATLTLTDIKFDANGPDVWGNNIYIKITHEKDADRFTLSIFYWKVDPSGGAGVIDPSDRTLMANSSRVEPDLSEVFTNLSFKPASSDFYVTRVNANSQLIRVTQINVVRPAATLAVGGLLKDHLKSGSHTDIADSDYNGSNVIGQKTGLKAFEEIDEISIIASPDENVSQNVTAAIINHCESLKDRFAICSIPSNKSEVDKIERPADSKYAAVYYPWINIPDPATARTIKVPPTGHIAGIYARSDTERGVHKAPANEVVRGATGLEYTITKGEHDFLNPKGINVIRAFPGRGIRVWGARTMSSDSSWKYINVRRLFNYVEESIDEGTQWVVFEPNDEKLWARVRQSISNFLTTVWSSGALMGSKASQAFFVKCDYTTMTQGDIDNGRLICIVGIAPVKPAEFVIFRIQQKTLESTSAN